MKIGEKIKRVRLHRHMKQRELGELVGFTDGAANRIAQYESWFRVPKEEMVKKIAAALDVAECALLEPDTGNLGGFMETLFWMDEDMPDVIKFSLSTPLEAHSREAKRNSKVEIQTNAATIPFNTQPVMLWSENDLLNYLFKSFAAMQDAYHSGKISRDKYFEWKLQWSYDSALPISATPKEVEALLGYNKNK